MGTQYSYRMRERFARAICEAMLRIYAAWIEGATDADIQIIKQAMDASPSARARAAIIATRTATNRTKEIVINPLLSPEFGSRKVRYYVNYRKNPGKEVAERVGLLAAGDGRSSSASLRTAAARPRRPKNRSAIFVEPSGFGATMKSAELCQSPRPASTASIRARPIILQARRRAHSRSRVPGEVLAQKLREIGLEVPTPLLHPAYLRQLESHDRQKPTLCLPTTRTQCHDHVAHLCTGIRHRVDTGGNEQ
jgi:hypothetical protein